MRIKLFPPENDIRNKITAILLCAGEGIRLKEVTRTIPKPLIKIESLNNDTILGHSINNLANLGIKRIAIVKGHLGEKIEEFICSLKKSDPNLENKLETIDSGTQYKLGPLYSFLSITKNKTIFKNEFNYILIPGDTIFQLNLISQVISLAINNLSLIQKFPLIFYRKINTEALKENLKYKKKISIADVEKTGSRKLLKEIKQLELQYHHKPNFIRQVIPLFIFSYNFINEIIEAEKKSSVHTIREIINSIIKENRKAFAIKIDKNYEFYDIDYKIDLINYNDIEKNKGQ